MSLIVPDFTISVYLSSYSLFFGLIPFAPLSALSIHFHLQCSKECLSIYVERKEERIKPKKGELHELPYKEIVKSGTVRLASGFVLICGYEGMNMNASRRGRG